MTRKLITFSAGLLLALLLLSTPASAQDTNTNCTPVYGGGQICGDYTPAPTGLETSTIMLASAGFYSAGLASFILSKKVRSLLPKSL